MLFKECVFINNVKSPVLLNEADYIFKFKKEGRAEGDMPSIYALYIKNSLGGL